MPEYLKALLASLPLDNQHHGSTDDQLLDTAELALRLGMEDAANFILPRVDRYGLTSRPYVERLESLRRQATSRSSSEN